MLCLTLLLLSCGNSSGGLLDLHLLAQRYLAYSGLSAIKILHFCHDLSYDDIFFADALHVQCRHKKKSVLQHMKR